MNKRTVCTEHWVHVACRRLVILITGTINSLLMPIPGAARGAVESAARHGMGSDDDEGVPGADLLDGVRS